MNATQLLNLFLQDHVDTSTIRDAFANNTHLVGEILADAEFTGAAILRLLIVKHPVESLQVVLDAFQGRGPVDAELVKLAVTEGKDEHRRALLHDVLVRPYNDKANWLVDYMLECGGEEVVEIVLNDDRVSMELRVEVLLCACGRGADGLRVVEMLKPVWKDHTRLLLEKVPKKRTVQQTLCYTYLCSPLEQAMEAGSVELVQYLVEEVVVFPPTALQRAFKSRNVELVRWICEHVEEHKPAEMDGPGRAKSALAESEFDSTAAVFAAAADAEAAFWLHCVHQCKGDECCQHTAEFVVRLLPAERLREIAGPLLFGAIKAGWTDVAKRLLEVAPEECVAHTSLFCPAITGPSPPTFMDSLRLACRVGAAGVVQLLLDAGMPLAGAESPDVPTPLSLALQHGHRRCAELLMERADARGESLSVCLESPEEWGTPHADYSKLEGALDVLSVWVERRDVEMCRMVWERFGEPFASVYDGDNHPTFVALVDAVLQNEEPEKAEEMAAWLSETSLVKMAGRAHSDVIMAGAGSGRPSTVPTEFAQLERGLRLWPNLLTFRYAWKTSDISLLRRLVECNMVELVAQVAESEAGQRVLQHPYHADRLVNLVITAAPSVEMVRRLLRVADQLGLPVGFGMSSAGRYVLKNWHEKPELMDVYFSEVPQTTADLRKLHVTAHRYGLWEEVMSAAIAFGHLDPRDDDAVVAVFCEAEMDFRSEDVARQVRFLLGAGASPWALAGLGRGRDLAGLEGLLDDAEDHARLFQVLVGLNVGGSETALGRMKAHSLFDVNVLPIVAGLLRRDASKPWKHLEGTVRVQAAPTGSLAAFVPDDVLRSAVRPSADGAFTFEVDVQQALAARAAPARGGGEEVAVAEPEQPAWSFGDGAAFEPDVGSFSGGPLVNPFEDSSAPGFGSSAAPSGDGSAAPFSFSFSSVAGSDDSANPFTADGSNPFAANNPFS